MAQLAHRLEQRRLSLEVTPGASEWLGITGYDPAYGARPLRRLVQREIGDRLARGLLSGAITDGDTVLVDVNPDVAQDGLTVTASHGDDPQDDDAAHAHDAPARDSGDDVVDAEIVDE